jgi:hypothetical protein
MFFLVMLFVVPLGYLLLAGAILGSSMDKLWSLGWRSWIIHTLSAVFSFAMVVGGFALVGALVAAKSYFSLPAIIAPWVGASLIWFFLLRTRTAKG